MPDRSGKIRKTASTDYAKLAKAIGDITARGINVSLIDINKSSYGFKPDIENNAILFGMKGLNKVGEPVIEQIIEGRPYSGIIDFMNRCKLNKTAMISLIKAGAFDNLDSHWAKLINEAEPRKAIMAYFIEKASEPKKKLTLQNFNGLIQKELVPTELEFQKRTFIFNKYLKDNMKSGRYYVFNQSCIEFYEEFFDMDYLEIINGATCILQTNWDKIYQTVMDEAREWLKNNQEIVLNKLNESLFKETWNKYANGSIAAWEMESLCFYHSNHELASVDIDKYGIVNFDNLPTDPDVEYFFKRNGKEIPIYKTYKIIGTIIAKNDNKSSISLLTTDGVVNVKFTKEHYAMYKKQISEIQEDGTKKVQEKGWFGRGNKVMITGFRRDDMFQVKTYKHTASHSIYKILEVKNGELVLEHNRYGVEDNE